MQLDFARPWALLLLPICAGIVILISILDRKRFQGRHTHAGGRRFGEIIFRSVILSLVVFALAGTSVRKTTNMVTTVYLVDLSDSTKEVAEDEIAFVKSAIARMPNKNQAGIIVFGQDAKIEQFISDRKSFTDVQSQVSATATNLQQAVATAMALFPDDTAKRLVLLTDGAENEGNLADLAVSFSGANIELKVMKYDSSIAKEVYVENVELPEHIAKGDQFQVHVEVIATEPTDARVSLYSGRTLKGQKDVSLQKGSNQLVFADEGVEDGLKSYRVVVEAEKDTVSVNNSYSAFTTVEAQSKILVVEGNPEESAAFQKILDACNYGYDVVSPSGVPGNVTDLLNYQSVVMIDVFSADLREGFLDTLDTYVKDYAGGFIAIGGPNSYALGNYRNTPLEKMLPVKMDLEGEKQIPKLAMTMVIDHSGSMSQPSTLRGGVTCMDVAKQAAVNALDSLREIDEVGVLAFDDSFDWAVPIQPAGDIDAISERIESISIRGGTSIYPAIAEAVKQMEKSDAKLKHIVLLTDGQDSYQAYQPLIDEMVEKGITLSTVAIGQEADTQTMQWLAENGGGRYYYSDAGSSLPRIFAQEVYLSAKSYLINEEFTPTIVNSHDILKGIFDEGSPNLLGYIATTPKSSATVLLESHREDPVLAVWQYGLGHTVAWTSDGTGEWTGNFAGWDSYAKLWRNIMDWTISDSQLGEDALTVEQKASSAVIHYETKDYASDTKITALITDEEGKQKEVTLKATSPGVYQKEVPLDKTGVYSINLRNTKGQNLIKNVNTATAMQYSQEYRYADVSSSLDSFVGQVDGIYIEEPRQVYNTKLERATSRKLLTNGLLLLSVILFVLDVVFRRMSIDWVRVLRIQVQKVKENLRIRDKLRERDPGRSKLLHNEQRSTAHDTEELQDHAGADNVDENSSDTNGKTHSGKSNRKKEERKEAKAAKAAKKAQNAAQKAKQEQESVIDAAALLQKKKERNS